MITIYSKNNCSYCMMAKALLKNNDIEFEEVNVEQDQDAMSFVLEQGLRSMPQIFRNGELFVAGGYTGLMQLGVDGIRSKLTEQVIDTASLGTI
jgi:glutaredoxin-like protein NrdH